MIVKLLTEHHLEFLGLKGGCRGSSESTLVKLSNCWKSHVTAHIRVYVLILALASCPDGYTPHHGSCYKLLDVLATWAEAIVSKVEPRKFDLRFFEILAKSN